MGNTQKKYKIVGYKRQQPVIKDPDRVCTICAKEYKAVSPLQKTCSKECRKVKDKGHQTVFKAKNPDCMKQYNKNRVAKNPDVWKEKWNSAREEIIHKLGGKCFAENCDTVNPLHLHLDYIPTMIGTGYTHPRYRKWVLDNISDFRILCANHHYELTITGKIVGSTITQKTRLKK